MNVSCPQCRTVFRVNPAKVPEEGVRARCAICGSTFEVTAPASEAEPAGVPSGARPSPGLGELERSAPPAPARGPAPAPLPSPAARPPAPPPAPPPGPPETPAAGAGLAPPAKLDPRPRRLARALVSDLVTYHPDLQERGLREGRLKELFREEIKKSWQEYVEQVGLDMAKSSPYFRDALNEILARGQKVF